MQQILGKMKTENNEEREKEEREKIEREKTRRYWNYMERRRQR